MRTNQKHAVIIGCGIAGPVVAMALQRIGMSATIYEAQPASADYTGAFLNLAPNGVNALRTLGLDAEIEAHGFPCTGMIFWNGKGRRLGALSHADEQRYGARSMMIKRALLHEALREEAVRRGIRVEHGKKLAGVEGVEGTSAGASGQPAVTARFEDGTRATGDVLIGCDGIHSRTRQLILPDAPRPVYTGMIGCGGFTHASTLAPASGATQMTFGKRAFFGYFATPPGEVYWFNNISYPGEPTRAELAAISQDGWRQRLLALHDADPAPIPDIIRSAGDIGLYPIYDIPSLPAWHRGLVCLVGDAAHATSPHAGQGASMALEDALVLAKCLRDIPAPERAFATFQSLRKQRVEKLILQARRTGAHKAVSNPLLVWMRDRMMSFFLARIADDADAWVYSYQVDWEQAVA
jgi:2-polyprenyl-6-methoxyphenol hydroxylase-like FAD-dependent oxidoreductase